MDSMPDTPDPQTRTAVTQRIIAHVTRGWPRLGEPIVRHRGRYCYVSAVLPGHREPTPDQCQVQDFDDFLKVNL